MTPSLPPFFHLFSGTEEPTAMKLSGDPSMTRAEIEEILASPIPWTDEVDQKRCEVRL